MAIRLVSSSDSFSPSSPISRASKRKGNLPAPIDTTVQGRGKSFHSSSDLGVSPETAATVGKAVENAVTAVFSGMHSFNADMTDLKDPFGNSVSFGSVSVNFDPSCTFLDDASNEAGFFALFNGLSQGETLEVEVFGLGTVTTPNEILSYEIKARVH